MDAFFEWTWATDFRRKKEAPRGASDYIMQRGMLKGEHPPPQANFGVRHDAP